MNKETLIKLAKENPEIMDALLTITKTAANESTQFNESVPAIGAGNPNQGPTPQGPMAGQGAAPVQAPAGAIDANAQAMAMAGQDQGVDPGAEGAKAAQTFFAPVFDAAAQGDPNAQKTLAIAAGEIARGVAQAAHEATTGEPAAAPMTEQGGAAPVAAVPASPEEAAANQIVADPAQGAPVAAVADAAPEGKEKPPEGGEQGKEVPKEGKKPFPPKKDDKKKEPEKKEAEKTSGLMFSADTLKAVVQMVRDGLI